MQKNKQSSHEQEQLGNSSSQRYEFIWENLKDYQISESQMQKYKEYMNEKSIDLALGCMFGAFIGDALGSFLQFRHNITEETVDKAMEMPGHGTFDLQPGQFTDDSEMASHLLKALMKFDPKQPLDQQEKSILVQIAKQYTKWFLSGPFDIGITTRTALDQISYQLKKPQSQSVLFQKLLKAFQMIEYKNEQSQSNGSLMRITPMAFFISLLTQKAQNQKEEQITFEGLRNLIKGEISMTHGNPAIYESSQAWVYLLVSMISREERSVNEVYNQFQKIYSETEGKQQDKYNHVKGWIEESKIGEMDARNSMGWAKIAFTYGLRHLRDLAKDNNQANFANPSTYKRIIRSVLSKKGDTDTNAAIVGGLIGAVIGFKNLPLQYLKTQFQLRLSKSITKSSRAPEYEPRQLFYNALQIIQRLNNSSNKDI